MHRSGFFVWKHLSSRKLSGFDCHGDVISLIFFDILLYSLFHLIEVKKKCSLKIILKSILREILLCRRMNFRTVGECMMLWTAGLQIQRSRECIMLFSRITNLAEQNEFMMLYRRIKNPAEQITNPAEQIVWCINWEKNKN